MTGAQPSRGSRRGRRPGRRPGRRVGLRVGLAAVLTILACALIVGPVPAALALVAPAPAATGAPSSTPTGLLIPEQEVTPPEATEPAEPQPPQESLAPTPPEPTQAPTLAPTQAPTQAPTEPEPEPSDAVPTPEETTPEEPAQEEPTPEEPGGTGETDAPVVNSIPPASASSTRSDASWIIALVVLAASGLLLLPLRRRAGREVPAPPVAATYGVVSAGPPAPGAGVTFSAIEAVGTAMLDATYSVITIETVLRDIARVNAYPATEVVVLPTALFVSTRGGGELHTGAISSGHRKLLLHQVDALDHLVRAARVGDLDPAQILRGIRDLRAAPPPFSPPVRVAAHVLLCAGLAVILGASLVGIAVASVLGGLVGIVRLMTAGASRQREPLVTVTLAFGVSAIVFLLVRSGWDPGVLPSLIAPLVILLPGALLTTGIIELSAGQMMSGAGRLMAGFMQLVLLAVGIVAGAALVGVPQIALSEAHHPIGPAGPWIAVAAFGVGVVVHQCGRRESIPWILLVLYVAYGAQVIGDIFFGGVLSALIGAFVMTPVAILVARHRSGPAAAVSFLPAFWLLVPGALGLVGVTELLGGAGDGMSTLVTTISTMVAIALGILAGSALSGRSQSARDVL